MIGNTFGHRTCGTVPICGHAAKPVRDTMRARVDTSFGWRTNRVVNEGPVEVNAALRDPVHVRCRQSRRAQKTHLRTLVVGQNEEDVVTRFTRIPEHQSDQDGTGQA